MLNYIHHVCLITSCEFTFLICKGFDNLYSVMGFHVHLKMISHFKSLITHVIQHSPTNLNLDVGLRLKTL